MNKNTKYSLAWEKTESEGNSDRPTSREGHIFVYLNDKNLYLLFGGISNTRYSDVYILSTDTMQWTEIKPTGEIPKECSYGAGWYDSPYLFFFGGRNREISLSDTYFLDTDTWVWRKIFSIDNPPARYHHAVIKTENKEAYIFGGYDEKRNRCLGDLFRYEYKGLKITSNENDKVGGSSWISVHDSGTKPPARKGHSMIYYKGSILLYGGVTNKGYDDENFYKYAIDTRQWKIFTISGVKPGARAFHSMNFFKQDTIVIFGGKYKSSDNLQDYAIGNDLFYIDLTTTDSTTPFVANICPTARYGHACSYNNNFPKNFEHVIVGGLDKTFCTFEVFDLKEIEFNSEKKWVYEQKKMRTTNIDNNDDVYETAKKTIINCKRELEQLSTKSIEVNKKYSDYLHTLNIYKRSVLQDDISNNEKKSQQRKKIMDVELEKRNLSNEINEYKEYNNLLNSQLKISREKFLIMSTYLEECIEDVKFMDDIIYKVDKHPNKMVLLSNVDVDSLSYKRKQYRLEVEKFKNVFENASFYENELYYKQNEQINKFKNEYYLGTDEKQVLSFKDVSDSTDK